MSSILKDKFSSYREPQYFQSKDIYPFFREIESEQGTEVIVKGKKALMFGSNSYLGLTTHPKIKEAAINAIKKYGSSVAGSRFLNGTTDLHIELEHRLAKFLKREAVLLFSTGFQVNIGTIPTITGKDDVIFLDRLNHASIIEGARLSQARSVMYRHNDMESLEHKLKLSADAKMKLIVVDGIFSMEGDIVKLPEIVQLAKKYNAVVMTDCAHAIGVIGDHGSGTPSHFGLDKEVDLIGGTFSKSLASLGGFIGADADTINFMKHHSRSLIFSAALTPASAASALAALDIIESDDSLRLNLLANTDHAIARFKDLGFDTGATESPIIPLYIRDNPKTYQLTMTLLEKGIFVNPVVAPAVSPEDTLIRFSLMASHTKDQIDKAIDIIYQTVKELNISLAIKAA
ncbi:pyridoxal phosphate-dependent aminotransferase family protein [Marinoscillum sp. MHG1-6]|uniref:aminotransferase class I/II-fold pyridoxal phosphate-dependent enzyme n=1 Tax=Marinoscillum sp. MHG1-6 TaxID=2959627 RepID=UPI002157AE9F|nr:pyridoxal phosphate-dependent aminotransferase family protein [Marinoscillum sp. MHG1-6]